MCIMGFFFFFKQKTAYEMRISDWSSDVCSSDLQEGDQQRRSAHQHQRGDERGLAAGPIAEMSEYACAQRTGDKGEAEACIGGEKRGRRRNRRKEQRPANQRGRGGQAIERLEDRKSVV